MPPDCVIALVHAVKLRQKELRDHTKVNELKWIKLFKLIPVRIWYWDNSKSSMERNNRWIKWTQRTRDNRWAIDEEIP